MKKLFIIFLFAFCFLIFPKAKSYSMEYIIGGKVWYVNWMPWLQDVGQTVGDRYLGIHSVQLGGGFMYGGSGSVRITNELTFSASYLYGVLGSDFKYEDRGLVYGDDLFFRQVGSAIIKRHDLDVALSYSVLSWLKVFVGYKFQPIDMEMKHEGIEKNYSDGNSTHYNSSVQKGEIFNHCPALGVGFSLPLSDIFVLSANISGLYLKGNMDYNMKRDYYFDADIDNPDASKSFSTKGKMDLYGWGLNIEPSIVAIFGGDILVVLGFRYQMIVLEGEYKGEGESIKYTEMYDHVYGASLNVMYRFR
ncbi:hypothetical protein ACFL20_02300 [Spirochaetota bacterium]